MLDELLCNVLRVKIQIYFHFFLNFSYEEHCKIVRLTNDSYGDLFFFAISMFMGHGISECPFYVKKRGRNVIKKQVTVGHYFYECGTLQ